LHSFFIVTSARDDDALSTILVVLLYIYHSPVASRTERPGPAAQIVAPAASRARSGEGSAAYAGADRACGLGTEIAPLPGRGWVPLGGNGRGQQDQRLCGVSLQPPSSPLRRYSVITAADQLLRKELRIGDEPACGIEALSLKLACIL